MTLRLDKLNKYKFIVISGEHYNPLGVVRTLGEYGIRPTAIIIKGQIRITSSSKYIDELYYAKDHEDAFNILRTLESQTKAFVLTCYDIDVSYMDSHYDEFKDYFYFYNAGKQGIINKFMKKDEILAAGKRNGLNVLENIVIRDNQIPENIVYPVITKAIISTIDNWKDEMHICNNKEELAAALKIINKEEVLVQKYIHKKNELCLEAVSVNHGEQFLVTIASTYDYLLPMSYSPYMTVRNFTDNELYDKLRNLIKEIGFEGIMEIEFLTDFEGNHYLGEINFRNSTWSYASTCLGMPLPILWAMGTLTGKLNDKWIKSIPLNYKAVVEPSDLKDRIIQNGSIKGFCLWIKDMSMSSCKYYVGKKDWKPVWTFFYDRVLNR